MFHIPNPKSLPKDPSDPQKRYDKTNHSGLYLAPKNPHTPKNPSTHTPTSQTTQSQQMTATPTPRNHSAVRQTPKLNQYGLIPIVPLPTPDDMLSYTGDQTFFHDPFAPEPVPAGSLQDLTNTLTQAKQTLQNLEDAYQALYQKTLTKNTHTLVDPITAQHAGRQKIQTTVTPFQLAAKQKDAVQATAQDPAVKQAQKNILTQQNTVQHTATQIDARGEVLSAQNLRSTANQATRAYYEEQKKATLDPQALNTLAEKAGTLRRTAELAEQKAKEAADAAGIPFETAYDLTPAEARVLYGDGIDTRTPPTKTPDTSPEQKETNTSPETNQAAAQDTPSPTNTKTPDTPPTSSPNQQTTLTTKTPSFTPTYATSRSGVVTGTAVASAAPSTQSDGSIGFTDTTGKRRQLNLVTAATVTKNANGTYTLADGSTISAADYQSFTADLAKASPEQLFMLIAGWPNGDLTQNQLWNDIKGGKNNQGLQNQVEAYNWWKAARAQASDTEPILPDGQIATNLSKTFALNAPDLKNALLSSGMDIRDIVSLAADFIPIVSQVKGLTELITGRDPITGDEVSRLMAASGLIPYGKISKLAPLVVRASNSAKHAKVMAKNLDAEGVTRPAGYALHHVIASGDSRAAESRQLLEKHGIDIDTHKNGVYLPPKKETIGRTTEATHNNIHTKDYYKSINDRLQKIDALPIPEQQKKARILATLEDMKNELLSGGLK